MNLFKGEKMDRSGIGLPSNKVKVYWSIMNNDRLLSHNKQVINEYPDEDSATAAAIEFIEEHKFPHELSIRKFVRPLTENRQ